MSLLLQITYKQLTEKKEAVSFIWTFVYEQPFNVLSKVQGKEQEV